MPEPAPDFALSGATSFLPLPGPGVRPQTLLLVEDSRHAAEAVRLLARRLGLRLRRAETLADARHHLRVYRPDTVLIDLGLPDGSGLELIAELAVARPRHRRIVALSAEADSGPEALAAGADAFVAKPLRLPADLPALLGEGTVAPGPWAVDGTSRNAGADPLALRDDLARACRTLAEGEADGGPESGRDDGRRRLDYAARFVRGVARCTGDAGLRQAADQARHSGRATELLTALRARTDAAAPF